MDKFLRMYHRGDDLARQGDKAHDFCVLRSGYVGIYRDNQQVATVHSAGEFIGEMAWLLGEPRTASARAETANVEVYVIPTAGFEHAVKTNPTLGLRLAQNRASRLKGATAQLSRERGSVPGQARLVGSDPATARLLNLIRAVLPPPARRRGHQGPADAHSAHDRTRQPQRRAAPRGSPRRRGGRPA